MTAPKITEGCPFCGDDDYHTAKLPGKHWPEAWAVTCLTCGAQGPVHTTKADAEKSWNERAKP